MCTGHERERRKQTRGGRISGEQGTFTIGIEGEGNALAKRESERTKI